MKYLTNLVTFFNFSFAINYWSAFLNAGLVSIYLNYHFQTLLLDVENMLLIHYPHLPDHISLSSLILQKESASINFLILGPTKIAPLIWQSFKMGYLFFENSNLDLIFPEDKTNFLITPVSYSFNQILKLYLVFSKIS